MLAVTLPSAQEQRELARRLKIRANFRLGAGDLEGAWNDIQAIHRISRLVPQGVTLIEALVGFSIDSLAFETAGRVLRSPKLTDDQARRFLADLKRLPRLPSIAEKIDQTGDGGCGGGGAVDKLAAVHAGDDAASIR